VPEVRSQAFEVEHEKYGTTLYVRLLGEFDLAAHDLFESTVYGLDGDAPSAIVIDLQGLKFIDSTGLRQLVALWERAQRDNFEFAIVPGSPEVQRAFELTGLHEVLPIAEEARLR
jgi:anti-sigma B factor antagonist